MYNRILDLLPILAHRSVFLFGPRQTGKSTYLKNAFPTARYVNLLKADEFLELSIRPESLRQSISAQDRLIIIDEVQKLPRLLDEVQAMMLEMPDLKFILTGSSARQLKRGKANLLAGRAIVYNFHPLVSPEIGYSRILERLNRGSLPAILDSPIYEEDLRSYVGTYLKEEILEEGLSRGLESFSRFLEVAALTNGKQINFTEIGNDAGVPPRIVREYYRILEDTLLGFQLPAFQKSIKRKPVSTAKFYFFDNGITNVLCRRSRIEERSELYGEALEQLIAIELKAYLDYQRLPLELSYWRSLSQIEVDFVIGETLAIEVKAKNRISKKDYKSLLFLGEDLSGLRKIVVCNEPRYRKLSDGIEIMPVDFFLKELWQGRIVDLIS